MISGIKSLIHRYYSWLTLISMENKDEYESDYAKIDVITDQVNSVLPDRPSNLSSVHGQSIRIGRCFWKLPDILDHNDWTSSIWRSPCLLGIWRLLLSDRRIGEIRRHANSWRHQRDPWYKNVNVCFYLSFILLKYNAAGVTWFNVSIWAQDTIPSHKYIIEWSVEFFLYEMEQCYLSAILIDLYYWLLNNQFMNSTSVLYHVKING